MSESKKSIKARNKMKVNKVTKSAICITCGEGSENHHGMKLYGDGLAKRGYTPAELQKIADKIREEGGVVAKRVKK